MQMCMDSDESCLAVLQRPPVAGDLTRPRKVLIVGSDGESGVLIRFCIGRVRSQPSKMATFTLRQRYDSQHPVSRAACAVVS